MGACVIATAGEDGTAKLEGAIVVEIGDRVVRIPVGDGAEGCILGLLGWTGIVCISLPVWNTP